MSKDWTGRGRGSIYTTLGASAHTDAEREGRDYYATHPVAAELLLEVEDFNLPIWEPCAGEGHIAEELRKHGHTVYTSDIIERNYALDEVKDFLDPLDTDIPANGLFHIVTNPPYKYAQEFIEKGLTIIQDGCKVAMFLKLTFCEGKKRKKLFQQYPPKTIYVSSSRIPCGKNGDFSFVDTSGSAVCYAWFVWEKGFKGNTTLKWIN